MIVKVLSESLRKIFTALYCPWRLVLCCLEVVLIVVLIAIMCNKPQPKPLTQTVTKYDTIRTADTITAVVPISHVVRVFVHDTVTNTVHDTSQFVLTYSEDSVGCLKGEFKAPDSAFVSWWACSKDFPIELKKNINWDVKYLPAPKIIQHDTRYDTIPIYPKFWDKVKTATMWVTVGAIIGELLVNLLLLNCLNL